MSKGLLIIKVRSFSSFDHLKQNLIFSANDLQVKNLFSTQKKFQKLCYTTHKQIPKVSSRWQNQMHENGIKHSTLPKDDSLAGESIILTATETSHWTSIIMLYASDIPEIATERLDGEKD